MLIKRLSAFALLATLVLPLSALADIARGINWLATQPNANGSFGSTPASLATPVQTTAEVLRAYQVTGNTGQLPFTPALAFINGDSELNTEFLSRKILVNVAAGGDVTVLVNALVGHQNADGGFGDQPGYASSVLGTAFALEALAAANYSGGRIVAASLGYLLNRQQANGGWADGANTSSVFLSARAMRGLWNYRNSFAGVSASLTKVQNFLLSQRSSSGLWREHFETASALLALIPNVADLSLVATSVGALDSVQAADGSWNEDSFTTALALQALYAYQLRSGAVPADQTGAISGYVLRAGSTEPIGGATVTVVERSVSVLTNADGYFLISNLPAGSYTLMAAKTGYQPASAISQSQGGQVTLAGNLILAQAEAAGLVNGKIFDAADLAAQSGAVVTLSGAANYSATTGATGTFSINEVAPGDYAVSIAKSGYVTVNGSATVAGGQALTINQGLVKTGGFEDTSPGTISGAVNDAKTGAPIAAAVFDLGAGLSAVTDANGQFSIASVPRGNYAASLSASGYVSQSYAIGFPAGALGNLGTLTLFASAPDTAPTTLTLHGLVVDGVSRAPIANASVVLVETGASAASGADGRFLLDGITLTNFSLATTAAGYPQSTLGVQVGAFGDADITVALAPPGSGATTSALQGAVRDATTSAPIAGARVEVTGSALSTLTDATGHYNLSGIDHLRTCLHN